jgi:hypothetical protein
VHLHILKGAIALDGAQLYAMQETCLESLCYFAGRPWFAREIWVAFDCAAERSPLLANIMNSLSEAAKPTQGRLTSLTRLALEAISHILTGLSTVDCEPVQSIYENKKHKNQDITGAERLGVSSLLYLDFVARVLARPDQEILFSDLDELAEQKAALQQSCRAFNASPRQGGDAFAQLGVLRQWSDLTRRNAEASLKKSAEAKKLL